MKSRSIVLALILALMTIGINSTTAAGYAHCVAVNNAEIKKSFGELVYSLDLRDLCDSGIRNYSFIFKPNKFSVSDVTKSYVILHGSSTTIDFSLNRFVPGDYSPTLEIRSSMDLERRTISLPRFTIESPVDCLQVTRSGLDFFQSNYSVTIRNICSTLDSYSFSNVRVQLEGNGLFGMNSSSQSLFSVSEVGTTLDFNVNGLADGTYFPSLLVEDWNSSNRKSLSLNSFTLKKATTQQTTIDPTKQSSKQLCVSGKNYSRECFSYPNFSYEICSSNQNGKVQYQNGSTWLFGWNFKGVKDLERCQSGNPFLISISGTAKSTLNMRLAFSKYLTNPAFYSNFKVTVA